VEEQAWGVMVYRMAAHGFISTLKPNSEMQVEVEIKIKSLLSLNSGMEFVASESIHGVLLRVGL